MSSLKKIREARLLTQQELAALSGVAISTISRLENATTGYRISTVKKLAKALGVEPQELLEGK